MKINDKNGLHSYSYLIYLHLEAYYIMYTTRNVFLSRCKKGYGTIEDITRNPLSKVDEVGNRERKGRGGDRDRGFTC